MFRLLQYRMKDIKIALEAEELTYIGWRAPDVDITSKDSANLTFNIAP